jgi:hypothetical protein
VSRPQAREWRHDELAADLLDDRHAAAEIAIERLAVRGGQLDVAAMCLSWSRPLITGYEVKISRADFLCEIRSEKWRNYLDCVERLYFAVPNYMVEPSEVPAECGLLYRGTKSWRWHRKAQRRDLSPERKAGFVTALLFRHYPAVWQPHARGLLTLPNGRRVTADEIRKRETRDLYGHTVPLDALPGKRRRGSR